MMMRRARAGVPLTEEAGVTFSRVRAQPTTITTTTPQVPVKNNERPGPPSRTTSYRHSKSHSNGKSTSRFRIGKQRHKAPKASQLRHTANANLPIQFGIFSFSKYVSFSFRHNVLSSFLSF
jgi:hypothetical protein